MCACFVYYSIILWLSQYQYHVIYDKNITTCWFCIHVFENCLCYILFNLTNEVFRDIRDVCCSMFNLLKTVIGMRLGWIENFMMKWYYHCIVRTILQKTTGRKNFLIFFVNSSEELNLLTHCLFTLWLINNSY